MTKKKIQKKKLRQKMSVRFPRAAVLPRIFYYRIKLWWDTMNNSLWRRIVAGFFIVLMLYSACMYGIARWYMWDQRNKPLQYGVTFIPNYARYFGLDPQDTMKAIIDELGVRQFRLVSYWKNHEAQRGVYDFTELDWQFKLAEESNSKVSLAIGLRQPRWPECHAPQWAEQLPMTEWAPLLKDYMGAVIDRYKDSPALESYQLENEFFMTVFGICPDHTRERLIDEFEYVKQKDPHHPVIISRSNNWLGFPLYDPRPDEVAISVYKRVWDKNLLKRYYEYPLPASFYAFLGGVGKIATGRDLIIHELQAEAWLPPGYEMNNVDHIPEQNKSLNAERLKHRIEYGRATGLKEIYLWGVEWWYWQKVVADDPSLWNTAKEGIAEAYRINGTSPYEN